MSKYDWIYFNNEFANLLLKYKNNRKELIEIITSISHEKGYSFPKTESDGVVVDIDPFSIFSLMNRQTRFSHKQKIFAGIKEKFGLKSSVPSDLSGVPQSMNQRCVFFYFKEHRGINDIDNLWDFYEISLKLSKNYNDKLLRNEFIEKYDKVVNQYGVKWNITMGLFWMFPNTFINLDSRNRWFLTLDDKVDDDAYDFVLKHKFDKTNTPLLKGKDYLKLNDLIIKSIQSNEYEYHTFYEFSDSAFEESQRVNSAYKFLDNDDDYVSNVNYFMYSPGENGKFWEEFYNQGIMALGWEKLGDLRQYKTKDSLRDALKEHYFAEGSMKNDRLTLWDFCNKLKIGDIIYVKKGQHGIIGKGIVKSDYYFDDLRKEYKNVRKVQWNNKGDWYRQASNVQKTLTDISTYPDLIYELNKLINNNEDFVDDEVKINNTQEYLKDIYLNDYDINKIKSLLKLKKNIILQGAPGVGKSYIAKKIAYSLVGSNDKTRVQMVQFHQSYSYEEFVYGYKPNEKGGFELEPGIFYQFCKNALNDKQNDYYFIIDEINRGNISKIFGELFYLLEKTKRENESVKLLYNNEDFIIPDNLYIIGTMNTADRSIALIDFALRRRFAFFELKPAFDNDKFIDYINSLNNASIKKLVTIVKNLNKEICNDNSLGRGFCIGHSFLCNLSSEQIDNDELSNIIEYELIPLLEEYWYDSPDKLYNYSNLLKDSIK